MTKYTTFNTIDEMFENSEFQVETAEDFKNIPDDEWDISINENTVFENLEDMQLKAFAERTAGQLGLK